MPLKPKTYQFLVGLFASLGSFTYGYDLGIVASVIATPDFVKRFDTQNHATALGLVVSLFTAGAFFGAFAAGYMGDILARRGTIAAASLIFIIGGVIQASAPSLSYIQGGRFITGFGVGNLCMIVPLYQAELSHPSIRGRIGGLVQFMLGIGAFCASWIGYGCFHGLHDSNQWRLPLGIQCVPAGFLGALIYLFPESPRWLIDHGRSEEGLKNLAHLHSHGDINDSFVRAEYEAIQDQVTYEHEHGSKGWIELVKNKTNSRRIFLAVAIQGSIQMTGVSCIQYYSTQIFQEIGIPPGTTLLLQAINSIIALIAQATCVLLIDRLGRRWPLISGNLVNMVAFIIATALIAKTGNNHGATGAHWGFVMMTWLYQFSFSSTCGPLSWIIPAEIFTTATRSKGVALATMSSFATNTLIGQVSPIAIQHTGWKYFYLFIICNFTNAVFFYCFLPETAKIPLEAMDALFNDTPIFVAGRTGKKVGSALLEDLERRGVEISEKEQATVHIE